jgi:DNA-directed RNA polymerase specialized sigma24 family protein
MIDPTEIEARFAIEDGMAYMASIFDEPSEEARERIAEVIEILADLPPREADFIDLYYFRRLKQTDIATIFNVSQPTVCYRLQRATARIQFLIQMPDVSDQELVRDLRDLLADPLDVQIMLLMKETTCQSEVAKRLGVSQGLVRHRFIRSLNRMRKIEGYENYVDLFDFISANLNILREVQRPAWDAKVTHTID